MAQQDYESFIEKFRPKLTTDDCYTPTNIYDVIADYVSEKYNVDRSHFVRPFYPGGDYLNYAYKAADVVVDNPPFSILSKIVEYYVKSGIKFFLFAPATSIFGAARMCTALCAYVNICYENGAQVNTSFITNLGDTSIRFCSCPELYERVKTANAENLRKVHTELPKYEYPNEVITAAFVGKLSKYGIEYSVRTDESIFIRIMDAQRECKKSIYGAGYLVSERAAAERAAAERAAAERAAAEKENRQVWVLSEREKEIVKGLSK